MQAYPEWCEVIDWRRRVAPERHGSTRDKGDVANHKAHSPSSIKELTGG